MKIERVALDLDGCLSGFTEEFCKRMDIHHSNVDIKSGIIANTPKHVMWKNIDRWGVDFWENMPIYPWAKDLWRMCDSHTNGNTYFLTAQSNNHDSYLGKLRWVKKHFNTDKVIITKYKWLLSGPNRLLVDDREKFIQPWQENGGIGYLWPHSFSLTNDPDLLRSNMSAVETILKG